jgi:hypothetical protein
VATHIRSPYYPYVLLSAESLKFICVVMLPSHDEPGPTPPSESQMTHPQRKKRKVAGRFSGGTTSGSKPGSSGDTEEVAEECTGLGARIEQAGEPSVSKHNRCDNARDSTFCDPI